MEYDDVMVSACAKKHCHSHDPKVVVKTLMDLNEMDSLHDEGEVMACNMLEFTYSACAHELLSFFTCYIMLYVYILYCIRIRIYTIGY